MNKLMSLIKVSLNHDMNIFTIQSKKQSNLSKILIPLFLTVYLMFLFGMYAYNLMDLLEAMHAEFIALTFFALSVTLVTFMEGIYKSGPLLFNCKDDQLLLSMPIKKSTVLFIRVFKFYVFEFLYNSLFLLPAIVIYAYRMNPSWTYYLTSVVALFLLPIVPIVLSCIIGFIITYLSSKFRGKNLFQSLFTMSLLLVILYISFNLDNLINKLAENATSINDLIIKFYYPVGMYSSLITNFDIIDLLIYILIHILLFFITIFILGKVYFKINSSIKRVAIKHKNNHYEIKTNSKMVSFVKKELNRFISTPVFLSNAGFGLFLFIIMCVLLSFKYDSLTTKLVTFLPNTSIDSLKEQLPVFMYALVCFTSLMTSITSSMISLESKSFNILKSLPIKSSKIVLYKIITALVIMIPCILIGDIIIFIRFGFDIISILLILIASIVIPFVSELIGILVNLKYPKLDATNDTEIVKQSMSSTVSVFIGMGLLGVSFIGLFSLLNLNISTYLIMLIFNLAYGIIASLLWLLLVKTSDKSFNNITT